MRTDFSLNINWQTLSFIGLSRKMELAHGALADVLTDAGRGSGCDAVN